MIRYIINIIITLIIIHLHYYYYYCHHCDLLRNQAGRAQSLGGGLRSYRGDAVLLEVGRHGRVAAQSLQLLPAHAAAAARSLGAGATGAAAHRQAFGLISGRNEVRVVALQDAADVAQQVVEELRNAFITWKQRNAQETTRRCSFYQKTAKTRK